METSGGIVYSPRTTWKKTHPSLSMQRRRMLWLIHGVLLTTVCFLLQQKISPPSNEQYAFQKRGIMWLLRTPYCYLLGVPWKYSLTTYLFRQAQQYEFSELSFSHTSLKHFLLVLPEVWFGVTTVLLLLSHSIASLHYGVALFMLVGGILAMHIYIWCQILWKLRPVEEAEGHVWLLEL